MTRSLRLAPAVLFLAAVLAAPAARAQKAPPPKPSQEGDTEQPKPVDTSEAPASQQSEFVVPGPAQTVSKSSEEEEGEARPTDLFYGVGFRGRWVTVPSWLLNLFTAKNVPLSSYQVGVELFRRHAEMDFVLGLSYQNMSPPDGNWLGKGKEADQFTDFVQFRGLGMAGLDAAFIGHKNFNEYFGIHYGAGIGVAIVTGKLLRTSSLGCTDSNLGDLSNCHPKDVVCNNASGCNEQQLAATSAAGGRSVDDPSTPSRFQDNNVPPVIPIVNVLAGVDFRVPQAKGVDLRLEGGFFNAFFAGAAVSYAF